MFLLRRTDCSSWFLIPGRSDYKHTRWGAGALFSSGLHINQCRARKHEEPERVQPLRTLTNTPTASRLTSDQTIHQTTFCSKLQTFVFLTLLLFCVSFAQISQVLIVVFASQSWINPRGKRNYMISWNNVLLWAMNEEQMFLRCVTSALTLSL